ATVFRFRGSCPSRGISVGRATTSVRHFRDFCIDFRTLFVPFFHDRPSTPASSQSMTIIWQPALSEEAGRWRAGADRLTQAQFAPLAEALDRAQRYPWENVRALVEHKLAGLFIPKAYGGEGADLGTTVAVVEAIATGCASTAAILCTYQ